MALSFCDQCVLNWKLNTIMDCDLCKMHLHNGWSIEQMLEVYGNRGLLYDSLGMDNSIFYPPMLNRKYIPVQELQELKLENLQCYKKSLHLLNNEIQEKFVHLKDELIKFHKKENSKQRKEFLEQENFIIRNIDEASTMELKRYLFRGLDSLTQEILNK